MKVIFILLILILSNLNYSVIDSNINTPQKLFVSLTPFLLKNVIHNTQEVKSQEEFKVYISNLEEGCDFRATTITAKYLGSTKNFDIYLNSDYTIKNSTYNILTKAADEVYDRITEYFNKTPDNKDGKMILLFTPLNEKTQTLMVSGYTMPGYDINKKSIIYIDISFISYSNEIAFKDIIAHELTHYVQASYISLASEKSYDLWIIEGIANFMADYAILGYNPVAPELDYLKRYTNITFAKEASCLDIEGYLSSYLLSYLFLVYLSEKYGIDIVRKIMENYRYYKGFTLIEKVTGEVFANLYKEFVLKNLIGNYKETPFIFENTYFKYEAKKKIGLGINDWIIKPLAFDYILIDNLSLISLTTFNDKVQAILYNENLNKTYDIPSNSTWFKFFEENNKYTLMILNFGNLTEKLIISNYKIKEIEKYEIEKGFNKINIDKLNISLEINSKNDTYLYFILIENPNNINEKSKITYTFFLYYNESVIELPILIKINLDNKIYQIKYLDLKELKTNIVESEIDNNILLYKIYNQNIYLENIDYFVKIYGLDIEKLPFYFSLIFLLAILLFLQIYTIKRVKRFDLT